MERKQWEKVFQIDKKFEENVLVAECLRLLPQNCSVSVLSPTWTQSLVIFAVCHIPFSPRKFPLSCALLLLNKGAKMPNAYIIKYVFF